MSDVDKQCVVIVLDSVGVGEMPDAGEFGDAGADTLGHIDQEIGLNLPNLAALGLGNIARQAPFKTLIPNRAPTGAFGKMAMYSAGKDSATGHWELMGLITEEPFKTFPDGFPDEIIDAFITKTGVPGVLANRATSGTVIIKELGREHQETGKPIVYTSADPVFQIAAHEETIPIETLYEYCQIAYDIAVPYGLNRVIARPFVGTWPDYERTYRRRDFTVPPPGQTTLDQLADGGVSIVGVGKISQLYAGRGLSRVVKSKGNADGIEKTLECMKDRTEELVYTNLVDFDSKYGHRRNPEGYAAALQAFDEALPRLLEALGPQDLLILTADHGNDPTYRGTDHTREYVPVLAYGAWIEPGELGIRTSFADLGATVAAFLERPEASVSGTSFLDDLTG